MSGKPSLMTFSIGPVHTFIAQARRVADLWAGSTILSHLVSTAIRVLLERGGEMVFPCISEKGRIPTGLPNRFVCRIPSTEAGDVAKAMKKSVEVEWTRLSVEAARILAEIGVLGTSTVPDPFQEQVSQAIEVAWSWVEQDEGNYAGASRKGAAQFAGARMFRPYTQDSEIGVKCAVCGERTALPDGVGKNVRAAWEKAEAASKGNKRERYFRKDQTRLCLVCATKRLYPVTGGSGRDAYFSAFDRFEPQEDGPNGREARQPYFAVVSMDGDNMGRVLGWDASRVHNVEGFHRRVSEILTAFAERLRTAGSPELNLATLKYTPKGDKPPQLVYAGGEDILFICGPRDALPLAKAIREEYRRSFDGDSDLRDLVKDAVNIRKFTISAGILFAHTKHPAGLVFRDVQDLLSRKAKDEEGRDAVAIRLDKRGGVPVEVAFKWDGDAGGRAWPEALEGIVDCLVEGTLSSGRTFDLREEERILSAIFQTPEQWNSWLTEKLSRGEGNGAMVERLAGLMGPFFIGGKIEALRIARFLGREVGQ
ncbi:MAG: hypothetical protein HY896_10605 [Deltaproteobacteria bacterium]|nr:hypothetical protein [Deltaproteobacteria bacterium]